MRVTASPTASMKHRLERTSPPMPSSVVAEAISSCSSATTELGIGGDVRSSLCFIDAVGDAVTLIKNAPVISYGAEADLILVTARRAADSAPSDQVLVACDSASIQLEATGTWDTLGLRGTSS